MSSCPDHGPRDSHYYRDEDTGVYTGRCSCGHEDPKRHPRPASKPLALGDEPPF